MSDNYEPCFYNVSDDWQERWSLIREFTTKWHGIQFRDRKELLPLVKEEEDNLGFELPPSVREYIMFSADLYEQERGDILRDICQIKYHQNLSTIEILRQCEDDAFWGIQEQYISQSDPPIELYVINYDSDLEEFEYSDRQTHHLTSFILEHMSYFLFGKGGGYLVTIDDTSEFIDRMDISFDNKAIFDGMLIYESQNIISIVSCKQLLVELWKPLPKNKIPIILFDYINNGGCFWGVFANSLDSFNYRSKNNRNSNDD